MSSAQVNETLVDVYVSMIYHSWENIHQIRPPNSILVDPGASFETPETPGVRVNSGMICFSVHMVTVITVHTLLI